MIIIAHRLVGRLGLCHGLASWVHVHVVVWIGDLAWFSGSSGASTATTADGLSTTEA